MNTLYEQIVDTICSTLDLQTAFAELQVLLRQHTGIEGIFLGHHMADSKEVYHLAYADSLQSRDLDFKRPAVDELHSYLLSPSRGELNVLPTLSAFPAMAETLAPHIPLAHSLYELRVRLDGRHIGMLAFHTAAPGLSDDAVRLLMKIRSPVALALANRLRALDTWPGSMLPHRSRRDETEHVRGCSSRMHDVYRRLEAAAPTQSTMLLTGETGVGKEVYARYVHELSPRKNKPFVHVNCGGIAESLIDSELFGHKKGAFTGAVADHAGFFEQAGAGTIFLDEIGELPPPAQARLLLVLQNKTIRRIGDTRDIALDIRIIAATNCDLEAMCRAMRFRKDLLFRLNGITVAIPPLRERKEDIPTLAEHLLARAAADLGMAHAPCMPAAELERLLRYDWPGNVRELENCLRRSLILASGACFRADIPEEPIWAPQAEQMSYMQPPVSYGASLPREEASYSGVFGPVSDLRPPPAFAPAALGLPPAYAPLAHAAGSMREHMRLCLLDALKRSGGRIHGPGGAAEMLDVNPSTLRSRLRKLGIPYGRSAKGAP